MECPPETNIAEPGEQARLTTKLFPMYSYVNQTTESASTNELMRQASLRTLSKTQADIWGALQGGYGETNGYSMASYMNMATVPLGLMQGNVLWMPIMPPWFMDIIMTPLG
jgi:hypothetical protein